MWFSPSLIRTEVLEKIIRCSRSRIELDMTELLLDIMDTMQVDVVDFCINDLLALFNYSMVKMERHQVRNVLQQYWKLEPASNAAVLLHLSNIRAAGTEVFCIVQKGGTLLYRYP